MRKGGENGGMATIACTCLPTTFLCGWHIYMYYVLCRTFLSLQPLQSALLFWRVAAALSCGPTTIPLLHLCVCMSVCGVVPLRGGRRLSGAEPSVKNPLLHVSLFMARRAYIPPELRRKICGANAAWARMTMIDSIVILLHVYRVWCVCEIVAFKI